MKSNLYRKIEMNNAVDGVMNRYINIWSEVFQLNKVFQKFSENLSNIKTILIDFEKEVEPLQKEMELKRKKLIMDVIPVSNILQVFINDKIEKKYRKEVDLTRKKLQGLTVSELIINCKKTIKKAKKHLEKSNLSVDYNSHPNDFKDHISSYGLSNKMIEDLTISVKELREIENNVNNLIKVKKEQKKEIVSLLKKNDKLLKNSIDLLVSIYETRNPEFYKNYMESRSILDIEPEEELEVQ